MADTSVFDKFKSFSDYQRANEEFQLRKQQAAQQMLASKMQLEKASIPDLPQGYRWNQQKGEAELIPGVDPSFSMKSQGFGMVTPYQGFQMQQAVNDRIYKREKDAEAAEDKRAAKLDQATEKYSKQLTDSGIVDLLNSVSSFNNSTAGVEDLPGYGAGYALPDFLVGEQGRALRQDVSAIRNNILKARSGGAVTPQEADRLLQELGEGYTKNDAQLKRGVSNIEKTLKNKLSNINAGYDPEVVGLYQQRGGVVSPQKLSGAGKSQGGEVQLTGAREAVKKLYSPSTKKTKIIYNDGSEEIINGQ